MSEVLNVTKREIVGKKNNQRLRNSGKIPAVLYGNKEDSVSLEVCADEFGKIIRKGAKNLQLQGGASGEVVMRDVQWDTFGTDVLHIDFFRAAN